MCSVTIPDGSLEDWLSVLKPYQRSIIHAFIKSGTVEEAAERWLGATGSPNIVPFGGARDTKPFWERFQAEFYKYLCDDSAYVEEKKAFASANSASKAMIVSGVSAALGATIGFSATVLAPAVAILMFNVGKMGIRAYCAKDAQV